MLRTGLTTVRSLYVFRTEFDSLWHIGIALIFPPDAEKYNLLRVAFCTNLCFLAPERVITVVENSSSREIPESTYPIYLWNTYLPEAFIFYLKFLSHGCVHFFFQAVKSCVKNVFKNSHAITYQNLFLRNDPDIFLNISPISVNMHWMCLSCFFSCPASEVRRKDVETKVGSIPWQWHTHTHTHACTHTDTHTQYHLIAHFLNTLNTQRAEPDVQVLIWEQIA